MGGRDPRPVGRARTLLAAVEEAGAGAFVADTAPIIYRLERAASRRLVEAVDPLFDAVEQGMLGCIVSAISVAELLIRPFRAGPAAVAVVDAFLRQPLVGVVEVGHSTARTAAAVLARRRLHRLPDALIVATATELEIPVVTGDRRLAQRAPSAFLVADFA